MDSDREIPGRTRITVQLRQLRFTAGSLALNLACTVGRRASTPIERLTSIDRVREWCAGVGLELAAGEATPELLASLWSLREAVFEVLRAAVHGGPAAESAVALVNRAAAVALPAPVLHVEGLRTEAGALAGAELCSAAARDLLALLGDPDRRGRLRECDSGLCRMVYLDTDGGRPRRWCSQRCGNVMKAARHRARTGSAE
ncbi:MAG TPA: ABATE domain-containing protein [Pseudonocardiaceae bacterium]|jgi:predicted RNA-binding Zn ribbon-like protein|nr:ABATE domain-containing protein [Pseudonocardiaceae bacterium]